MQDFLSLSLCQWQSDLSSNCNIIVFTSLDLMVDAKLEVLMVRSCEHFLKNFNQA